MQIKGQLVDIENRRIFKAIVEISEGKINSIQEIDHDVDTFICPGFIDAHIHIESSMLVPTEFALMAVRHGTVATVSDPHEIANVLGIEGVEYMLNNAEKTPFKFYFGAPSCVPATSFETAGASIDSEGIKTLLQNPKIKYLAEMMNYPGVIYDDSEVHKKIEWAQHFNKPVDGHAPGLRGEKLSKYISAGISTDHEAFTYEEGLEKLQKDMKILIREGSAAKNFEALIPLLDEHYENMMFCSDDKHPDDLLIDHINAHCKRAVAEGIDVFKVLQAACINPIDHYGLEVGKLKVGDPADFIFLEDLKEFKVLETYIDGEKVFAKDHVNLKSSEIDVVNNFNTDLKNESDFRFESDSSKVRVIKARDGELITYQFEGNAKLSDRNLIPNVEEDILKMAVVNRYGNTESGIGFIKNIGIREGAIASTVAHDSHNIVVVGTSDEYICKAVNALIKSKGGICAINSSEEKIMPLPIAGIMSDKSGEEVAKAYSELDKMAKEMGSRLRAPFMTLSFMALLVIPSLKLSDRGLFDGEAFQFVSLNLH